MGVHNLRHTNLALAIGVIVVCFEGSAALGRDAARGYAPLRPVIKPAAINISPLAPPGDIVVKFREGLVVHTPQSRLGAVAKRVVESFTRRGLQPPVPSVSADPETLRRKREAAQDRVKTILADLSLYFRLPISDPVQAVELIRELNSFAEVEIAYFAPRPEVASRRQEPGSSFGKSSTTSTTPDFESNQLHLGPAPGGVDARAAWTLPGGTGAGTQVIDVEYGWQLTHEDLPGGISAVVIGAGSSDTDHGTAVLGEIAAGRNGYGMTGIAYESAIGVASISADTLDDVIMMAVDSSEPGDVLLIELQAPGPRYNFEERTDQAGYIPMEYWPLNFDMIQAAWAEGIIVCEAAGNGSEDLDDPIYSDLFDPAFRNSHAILCGAGHPPNASSPDRSKLAFSNWGQRVDLQGYGSFVYTLGYGDLYNAGGKDYWYTAGFAGTSSAAPIVAGTVLCVSGVFQQMLGVTPDSSLADSIRHLLINTGSPQQGPELNRHIGPRPDLRAALREVFDPVDSIWYGDIALVSGHGGSIPITLFNSHTLRDIYLPFELSGPASIVLDSITRGTRTGAFEEVQIVYDDSENDQMGFLLQAENGGGSPHLPPGKGIVANLWVHANNGPGNQVDILDSAWLANGTRLRLVNYFDDGYPDFFDAGSITTICACPAHGDVSNDGQLDITDVVGVIEIAFRGGPPAITDPLCSHATRADYNCDGQVDIVDVVRAIDHIFRGGAPVCNPCTS